MVAVKLRLTGHLTRAAPWVQATVAVPQSADAGLLLEAEAAPLRQQLQQAHEQLTAQQLQIQVGEVACTLSASDLHCSLGCDPSLLTSCLPKTSRQTVTYACHKVHVLTAGPALRCHALMPPGR